MIGEAMLLGESQVSLFLPFPPEHPGLILWVVITGQSSLLTLGFWGARGDEIKVVTLSALVSFSACWFLKLSHCMVEGQGWAVNGQSTVVSREQVRLH